MARIKKENFRLQTQKENYKFMVGQKVFYRCNMFEKYKGVLGIVLRRTTRKSMKYCHVWFEDLQEEREFHEKFLMDINEYEERERAKQEKEKAEESEA